MAARAEQNAAIRETARLFGRRWGVRGAVASALAAALALAALPAQAEVPGALALQGRLTNAAGFPVPDGDYGLTLRF